MLRIKYSILVVCVLICNQMPVWAQHVYFPHQGTVHFEKTIFLKNLIKRYSSYESDPSKRGFFERFLEQAPETVLYNKTLLFNGDEVSFEHIQDEEQSETVKLLATTGVIESGVHTLQNLQTKEMRSFFELGGQDIFIQDSLVQTKWRITNEYRNIAGYNCRRANGIVMDSIYVVAFYTDEIPVSAGPSVFNGLPGMILGMAVPELHYNVFATKVDLSPVVPTNSSTRKRKAKPMTRKEVYNQLNAVVGSFLGQRIFNLVMAGYFL